jgi:hypothetical protein
MVLMGEWRLGVLAALGGLSAIFGAKLSWLVMDWIEKRREK